SCSGLTSARCRSAASRSPRRSPTRNASSARAGPAASVATAPFPILRPSLGRRSAQTPAPGEGDPGVTLAYELLAVAALILLNAFFVAAEYGLVTARRTRIVELHHQGNRRARDVMRITSDPPRFISAMQLGVTLTSLAIGALGEQALSDAFEPLMATFLAIAL